MKNDNREKGIAGLAGLFKKSVGDLQEGSTIAFAGSIGSCPPMAELMAFAVRRQNLNMYFIPLADPAEARSMEWIEGLGFTMSHDKTNLQSVDALILMGGLAMPKIGCPVEDAEKLIEHLGNPRLVGVGYMDVLESSGWTERLPFDFVIDGYMDASMQTKD